MVQVGTSNVPIFINAIRFVYPFQWGAPSFSAAGTVGLLSGVFAGMLESIGDYYAAADIANIPPPPVHAINRGRLNF